MRVHGRRRFVTCFAALLVVAACGRTLHPPDPEHDVDVAAPDGVVLKGSYFSPGKPGPGILLIHQCNMDRHAWDTLTPDLVSAGLHVLTYDQRGFGDTPGSDYDAGRASLGDADAALSYLGSRPGVDGHRLAAGGASCGALYSATLARRRSEIRALLLMSGWVDDQGVAYIKATPGLAVFGAAGERSGSDAADIRKAVAASSHPQSASKIISGRAHGMPMFADDADLKPMIVQWLSTRLSESNSPR